MSRFAILDCEDFPHWGGHASYWLDRLPRAGETWDVYRAWAGELPAAGGHDAYVITGSHHSVNDETQAWLPPLFDFVRTATADPAEPRVLGACFGLQVIAKSLGGRVEENPVGRFIFGTEQVSLEPSFHQEPFAQGAALPPVVTVLSSHGEQAVELPPGARRLAGSATSENEIFAIDRRVLAAQFHAEFDLKAMLDKILPSLRERGRLTADEEERARASLVREPHSAAIMATFRRFLDG